MPVGNRASNHVSKVQIQIRQIGYRNQNFASLIVKLEVCIEDLRAISFDKTRNWRWRKYRLFRHCSRRVHTEFRRLPQHAFFGLSCRLETLRSVNNVRAGRDYFDMNFLDENKTDYKKNDVCKCAAGSSTQLGYEYFQPVAETPIKCMLLLQLDQLVDGGHRRRNSKKGMR